MNKVAVVAMLAAALALAGCKKQVAGRGCAPFTERAVIVVTPVIAGNAVMMMTTTALVRDCVVRATK